MKMIYLAKSSKILPYPNSLPAKTACTTLALSAVELITDFLENYVDTVGN